MARHGGGQGVEGDAELGVGQGPRDSLDFLHGPVLGGQKTGQCLAGEKTQVGFVQQAFGAVAELAGHQLGDQARVTGIGDGQQHAPALGQQQATGAQHLLGVADVLEYVGADDGVVTARCKQGGQVAAFEVGDLDAAVVRCGQRGFFWADGQAVDDEAAALHAQEATEGAAAAAQV